jgi:hypothetical protein
MMAMAATTIVLTLAITFYVRFLVALCGECRRGWIGQLLRLEALPVEGTVAAREEVDESIDNAASDSRRRLCVISQ